MPDNKELARLPREELVKAATQMRNRAIKYKQNAESRTEAGASLVVAGIASGVSGYFMGSQEVAYQKAVADLMKKDSIERKDAEKAIAAAGADPRKFWGVDIDLVAGAALSLGGLALGPKPKYGAFVRAAGLGCLAGWLHGYGFEMALEAAEKEETEQQAAA